MKNPEKFAHEKALLLKPYTIGLFTGAYTSNEYGVSIPVINQEKRAALDAQVESVFAELLTEPELTNIEITRIMATWLRTYNLPLVPKSTPAVQEVYKRINEVIFNGKPFGDPERVAVPHNLETMGPYPIAEEIA
jgi:hypothetical protein